MDVVNYYTGEKVFEGTVDEITKWFCDPKTDWILWEVDDNGEVWYVVRI